MSPLVGPAVAAALLLVVGGALKVVSPGDTAVALRMAGVPVGPLGVRLASGAEAVVGAAAVVTGWAPAMAAAALSYLAFAAFVAWALARGLPLSSCGCLGAVDTPPTALHVALNLAAAAVTGAAAIVGVPALDEVLAAQPLAGIPFLLLVGLAAALAAVAMSQLPRTRAAGRTR